MLRRSVRRRSMLGVLLVLAASLSFPAATVAGNGYNYRVIWNYCSGNDVYYKVKEIAQGWTPTNRLTIDSWAQRQPVGGSGWTTVYVWNQAAYNFSANGQKHWLTLARAYNGNNHYWFRIVYRLRYWHNNQVLAAGLIKSVKC
jgi:hypothetical protein